MDIHSNFCYARRHETSRHAPTARIPETAGHCPSTGRTNVSIGGRYVRRISQFSRPLGTSPSAGRQGRLAPPAHSRKACAVVCLSESSAGPALGCRSPRRRLFHGCVDTTSNRTLDCPTVPGSLPPGARLAIDGATRRDLPEAPATSAGTRRGSHRSLEALPVAAYKKTLFNAEPIWSSSTKVGSCSSPTSVTPGRLVAGPRSCGTCTNGCACRPSPPLRSAHPAEGWASMRGSTAPISRGWKWSASCAISCNTCADPWSCSGTSAPSTGTDASGLLSSGIPACGSIASRPTLRNSIPTNSFGLKPSGPCPIRRPGTSAISEETCTERSGESAPPKRCFGPAFMPRNSRGPDISIVYAILSKP